MRGQVPSECKSARLGGFAAAALPGLLAPTSSHVFHVFPRLSQFLQRFPVWLSLLPEAGGRAAGRTGIRSAAASLRSAMSLWYEQKGVAWPLSSQAYARIPFLEKAGRF